MLLIRAAVIIAYTYITRIIKLQGSLFLTLLFRFRLYKSSILHQSIKEEKQNVHVSSKVFSEL